MSHQVSRVIDKQRELVHKHLLCGQRHRKKRAVPERTIARVVDVLRSSVSGAARFPVALILHLPHVPPSGYVDFAISRDKDVNLRHGALHGHHKKTLHLQRADRFAFGTEHLCTGTSEGEHASPTHIAVATDQRPLIDNRRVRLRARCRRWESDGNQTRCRRTWVSSRYPSRWGKASRLWSIPR